MPAEPNHRLRLRLPDGAEFEAEGTPDFISGERHHFIDSLRPPPTGTAAGAPETPQEPAWDIVIETKGPVIQLRSKLEGPGAERDACLILLAAARSLLRQSKPTASQIARWLRASGYPITRVDRTINLAVTQGEILASGTRRARCYELSGPGLAKGWRLAQRLSAHIQPAA
ncbi:MAG: hypothetical protein HY928_03865 [Elusimicrobia bacterium]|nr:hypothetical protein [Elusimicrobiota bacterium]